MNNKIAVVISVLILLIFVWWSGILGMFISPYKPFETRWGADVENEQERIQITDTWLTEIINKDYKWNSLLWIPYSDNTGGGFLEVSFNKRKAAWWDVLTFND